MHGVTVHTPPGEYSSFVFFWQVSMVVDSIFVPFSWQVCMAVRGYPSFFLPFFGQVCMVVRRYPSCFLPFFWRVSMVVEGTLAFFSAG